MSAEGERANAPTILAVRVRPAARRSAIIGFDGTTLRVDVAAPAKDNRANDELIHVLAESLGVGKSHLVLKRGSRSRDKLLQIDVAPSALRRWLAKWTATTSAIPK